MRVVYQWLEREKLSLRRSKGNKRMREAEGPRSLNIYAFSFQATHIFA